MAPEMRPKLPLVTVVTGPLKNCGELKPLMKSVRKTSVKRSVRRLRLITEISTLCTPGMRTPDNRDDHICRVLACRMVHAGCSPAWQFCCAPFASSVQVLNHSISDGSDLAGFTPVGAAPPGKLIGMPFCKRSSVLTCQPLMAQRAGLARLAPIGLPAPNGSSYRKLICRFCGMSQAAITRSRRMSCGLAKLVWSICLEIVYETLKFKP